MGLYAQHKFEPMPMLCANAGIQACMELNNFADITDEMRGVVTDYNRDDCVSTLELRNWLELVLRRPADEGASH